MVVVVSIVETWMDLMNVIVRMDCTLTLTESLALVSDIFMYLCLVCRPDNTFLRVNSTDSYWGVDEYKEYTLFISLLKSKLYIHLKHNHNNNHMTWEIKS
jgi:hypothetical protein